VKRLGSLLKSLDSRLPQVGYVWLLLSRGLWNKESIAAAWKLTDIGRPGLLLPGACVEVSRGGFTPGLVGQPLLKLATNDA
jgi:hypothetical protein